MYVVCADHVEQAIDEFLEEYGVAPDLYRCGQVSCTDWEIPATCTFCERAPRYLLI